MAIKRSAVAAGFVFMGVVTHASAAILQLNFTDGTNGAVSTGTIGSSGTWTTLASKGNHATVFPNVGDLKDSANANSGVGLSWNSSAAFAAGTRGENGTGAVGAANDGLSTWTAAAAARDPNSGVTYTADSKLFPWSVVGTYVADSNGIDGGIPRDERIAFTFTSATPLTYSFWVMSSLDHNNPSNGTGHFNIGGVHDASTNSFAGGTTLTLNGVLDQGVDTIPDSSETAPYTVNYQVGRLGTTFQSTYNGVSGLYELTFQAGQGSGTAVYLNGLIVEVVPEPASLALLGLGGLVLGRRRR